MLTRLSYEGLKSPGCLADLSHEAMDQVRRSCPGVVWKSSYVVLGPADNLDIFTAPDIESATKVATIIRTFGHATTEVWAATEWDKFTGLLRSLPPRLSAS